MHGMCGVKKPGQPAGPTSTLRLVMNLIPASRCMMSIPGDLDQLPYHGQLQGLVLQDGEFVLWLGEDLKC